ncbi:hypothetical protein Tco_0170498 [Tanacetum coccineum]
MRKQQVLGGNQRVEFSRLFVLDGFQPERFSPLAQHKVDSEPPNGSKEDITNQCESEQALNVSAGTSFNGQKQQRIDLNADALYNEKRENLRAPFLNVHMTSVHNSSGLALPRQMTSDHNNI